GKLSYMSPEQAARKEVDHRSDIFSLGIVLYEITVGKRLYRGPAAEVVHALIDGEVEPPTFARRNFPPALESIVMRTLEKHPEDRYQSAYDLADDLEAFLRDERLHSGPVRIARYLDMLTHAAGGTRRPELISETEARGTGDELDFDSQVFDGFAPSEGAPGPEQAPMWEDVDQPESEVAQALHIELAELRALRTPVPMRPAGMAAVRGSGTLAAVSPPHDEGDGEEAPATAPVPRMRTAEVYGDDDGDDAVPELPQEDDGSVDVDIRTPPKPIPAVADPRLSAEAAARLLGSARIAHDAAAAPQAVVDRPSIGSAYLARTQSPSKTPWVVVAILGVVVLALLAYIVMK
ncbi:MAG TPA: protein kinase, partial [Kofleriaceae bacterium]